MKRIAQLFNCFIARDHFKARHSGKEVPDGTSASRIPMVQRDSGQARMTEAGAGFTLIELLVVIIVVGILTSIGTASFFEFHHTQILKTAANDVGSMLSVAKSNSLSQLRSSCLATDVFDGYKVLISNSTTYTLYVRCAGIDVFINTKSLPENIEFAAGSIPSEFFFAVLTGSVTVTGSPTITLSGYGKTKDIAVSSTGVIQ